MADTPEFISVVVPVYNGARCIASCLDSLMHQTVAPDSYEIVVVDDGSTDETVSIVRQYPVQCLTQPHSGAATARNLGWRAAHGSLILFTDADCRPASDWIESLCAPFKDPRISGAKGVYRTCQRGLVARFVQLEYEEKYRRLAHQSKIDFVDTYSAAYRKSVLQAVGGFDDRFPNASVEDQELSFRLAKSGYRLVFQPQAVVYHEHVSHLLAYTRRKFRIGFWKALVHLRHPDKIVRDSHTPQSLKIQMLLIATMAVTPGLGPALGWQVVLWLLAAEGGLLLASMMPLAGKVYARDRAVLPIVPGMLIVRALALAIGLMCGIITHLSGHLLQRSSPALAYDRLRKASRRP